MVVDVLPTRVLSLGLILAAALGATGYPTPGVAASEAVTNTYQSQSLQPAEADVLRRKVLVQCGLDPSRNVLPWYFHFAYAQALLEAGDAQRAVTHLSKSIDLKPEPRAHKRTYGMWYTDYLPYFQLAEAHARLANWPCAERAMELSQSTGEISMGRIEPQRIRALQERIERHVDDAGACNIRDYQ
ncbi:MAG: hypothetical protein R3F08_16525 [Dokdonella sp.]|nr:hypothetical protein [Xanthomonadales bacterium]MCB1576406.1 hypothetical protein [Xanthomonadales bacterium]